MNLHTRRTLTCLVAAAFVAVFGTNVAQASSPARTYGDAKAVFEAGFTGGTNINILHNANANGAPQGILPTGDPEDVRVYPLAEEVEAYCASGWHVLNFDTGDSVVFYDSRQQLVEALDAVDILYAIDGTPLETQRTAYKRELLGDELPFTWVSIGALLPPGTLTVGAHELTSTFIGPIFFGGGFTYTVAFNVLPC